MHKHNISPLVFSLIKQRHWQHVDVAAAVILVVAVVEVTVVVVAKPVVENFTMKLKNEEWKLGA